MSSSQLINGISDVQDILNSVNERMGNVFFSNGWMNFYISSKTQKSHMYINYSICEIPHLNVIKTPKKILDINNIR